MNKFYVIEFLMEKEKQIKEMKNERYVIRLNAAKTFHLMAVGMAQLLFDNKLCDLGFFNLVKEPMTADSLMGVSHLSIDDIFIKGRDY